MGYSNSYQFPERCDEVTNWFKKFEMDFATLYFNEPDHTGHDFGPDSPQYWEKVLRGTYPLDTEFNLANL